MSGWKITAMVAAFVAAVGLLLWFSLVEGSGTQPGVGLKRLSGTVADGFVYRSSKESFPRAAFDAFRIGKVKAGVISLAPFSTVEFDNLVLNIPPTADVCPHPAPDGGAAPVASASHVAGGGVADALGIRSLAAMAYGKPIGRIGGIRINGLSIGRMVGKDRRPVLSARCLKNSGRKMLVEGLRVYDADGERFVGRAEFVTKPVPAIVWQDGRFELSELSSIFNR